MERGPIARLSMNPPEKSNVTSGIATTPTIRPTSVVRITAVNIFIILHMFTVLPLILICLSHFNIRNVSIK